MTTEKKTEEEPVIPVYTVYEYMLDRQVDTRDPCIVLNKPPFRIACGMRFCGPEDYRVRVNFYSLTQRESWNCPAGNYEYFPVCALQFVAGSMLTDKWQVAIGFAVAASDRKPEPEDVDLFRRAIAVDMEWRSKKEDMKTVLYADACDGSQPYRDPRAVVQEEWSKRYDSSAKS